MTTRTRIAPSPTGYPHIGTMYQALFDYAWAKRQGGKFVIRIEDTDRARLVEGAEDAIYDAFDWLNITEDESPRKGGPDKPYRQSERLEIYQKYAHQLVTEGHAYFCTCTKERLDDLRKEQQAQKQLPMYDRHCKDQTDEPDEPYVIRMKIPRDESITFTDGVRGEITFEGSVIDDQVILKSDGFPTYHLAVVVDDHLMNITHVIRGEEWISSTPKHCLLYKWLGWDMPEHFHTPLLRNPDKSKLSKRHGHTDVRWYISEGILPEALRNFLALMGWSHPEGREIFTLDEFVDNFDPHDLKTVGPVFDLTKLMWINGEYIRAMPEDKLADRIFSYSTEYLGNVYGKDLIKKTIPLVQTRLKSLREYDDYCRFFIEQPEAYDGEVAENAELYADIAEELRNLNDWKAVAIGEKLQALAESKNIPFSKFFMALRLAITGRKITPPLNESLEILGKDDTIERLERVVDR